MREIIVADKVPDRNWRMVTFVEHGSTMQAPALASIRGFLYDAVEKASHRGPPPIRVRWGEENKASPGDSDQAAKPVKPVPGTQEPLPVPRVEGGAAVSQIADPSAAAAEASRTDTTSGRGAVIYLPPPQPVSEPREIPKKTVDLAGNTAPSKIPDSIAAPGVPPSPSPSKSSTSPQVKEPAKVFENERQAIQTEGSGLFSTQGFPLGEYATMIIERIKANWFIPSNLKNSQGRTTVIFFIEKDGRYSDMRIVGRSGSASLDLAALNAVLGSNPFPPLPKGFPGDHVGAKFVFSYNERQ